MNWDKANRILFDVICIIVIVVLPYFVLNLIGIVDYVKENEHEHDGE